jgi:hypothetical protein
VTTIVDLDDRSTWPSAIDDFVGSWVERCRGKTKYTADLDVPLELEDPFVRLLDGRLLRAYHATRLLDHEVQMVRSQGLRALSGELVRDRINAAREAGEITADLAAQLQLAHVFSDGDHTKYYNRENRVCCVLGRQLFRRDPRAVALLLNTWGGEGIYMSENGYALRPVLEHIGQPTIVVALLDLSGGPSTYYFAPALHRLFVGSALGLKDAQGDAHYRASIPQARIEAILRSQDRAFRLLTGRG